MSHSHSHSHGNELGHSHSHVHDDPFGGHGHSHEILDGPGSFLNREMPLNEERDWKDRAFTIGIGGLVILPDSFFCPFFLLLIHSFIYHQTSWFWKDSSHVSIMSKTTR